MAISRRIFAGAGACLTALGLFTSCMRVEETSSAPFSPVPNAGGLGEAPPRDQQPPSAAKPPQPNALPETERTPRQGDCPDPDGAVIATCMQATVAVVGLPHSVTAIVAERDSGVLRLVSPNHPPKPFAKLSADAGKVLALAVSPTYDEDKLVYAALSRDGKTRIVRVAEGDREKAIAEGLPTAEHDAAGLAFDGESILLGVGTQILRLPDGGAQTGPATRFASVSAPITALCTAATGQNMIYAALSGSSGAEVTRIEAGAPSRLWSWPDRNRPGGCAVTPGGVAVAFPTEARVDLVGLDAASGIAKDKPQAVVEKKYGKIAGLGLIAGNALVGTTINKDGGKPGATDDRAIVLPFAGGASDERS